MNLKELRESKFLTQDELAAKAGVSQFTVTRLESGLQKPYFSTIKKLAKALDVQPGEIRFDLKV